MYTYTICFDKLINNRTLNDIMFKIDFACTLNKTVLVCVCVCRQYCLTHTHMIKIISKYFVMNNFFYKLPLAVQIICEKNLKKNKTVIDIMTLFVIMTDTTKA